MITKTVTTLNNVAMPRLIYGTAWKKEKTAELIFKAINYGFRGIDTACQPKHYNEAGAGEAIHKLTSEGMARDELYIQTKFTPVNGQDPFNIPYNRNDPLEDQVAQSFEVSKKNLQVSYVDGLILHSPLESIDQTIIAWHAMEQIYKQKGTKLLGISNCYDIETLQNLCEAASIKPAIVQNRFYPQTNYDYELRKWCREKNIIYQSFWTLTANPQVLSSGIIEKASQIYQRTAAQILFRVLLEIGIVPLTGTSSDKHMKEDLEIFNFDLPESIVRDITLLFASSNQLR